MSTAEIDPGLLGDVSQDTLDKLRADLVTIITGKPYLFARSTYAGELTLHFGDERKYTHPKLNNKVRGTYVLSVRGSAWILRSGIKLGMIGCGVIPSGTPRDGIKPFNITALESGALIGQGATVTLATPLVVIGGGFRAIGLDLKLNDGSSFTIIPTAPDNEESDLLEPADWELLSPTNVLRVGPGPDYQIEPL